MAKTNISIPKTVNIGTIKDVERTSARAKHLQENITNHKIILNTPILELAFVNYETMISVLFATRVAKINRKQSVHFYSSISSSLCKVVINKNPFYVPLVKDIDAAYNITYYTNIMLRTRSYREISNPNWNLLPFHSPLLESLSEDLQDSNKAKKWATRFRVQQALTTTIKVNLTKFINTFFRY